MVKVRGGLIYHLFAWPSKRPTRLLTLQPKRRKSYYMSLQTTIQETLWWGEQIANSLPQGGIRRQDMEERWSYTHFADTKEKLTRKAFRTALQHCEELFDCVLVCDDNNGFRWYVEGGKKEEERFVRKVKAFKEAIRI